MSVTFHGKKLDGSVICLDIEHPAHLNMSSANARAFLSFLGVEPGDEPCGEITTCEARRAVIRARAMFDRRVGGFTREGSDTKRRGKVRVVACGIDGDYFRVRLDSFERFVNLMSEVGAASIYWA